MKKKIICALLCTLTVASLAGCGKKVDMDALKEEMRAEIMEEMEAEQEKADREAEREARREEREKEDADTENIEDIEDLEEPKDDAEVKETPTKTPVEGSTDWLSMSFVLDGKTYALPFSYSDIEPDWSFDLADYGYEDGYVLNPGDYVYSTISLENDKYDCDFNIGIINNTKSSIDITEGDVWAMDIDITWGDTYPDLLLPGNLTWGSSLAEVEAAFGVPEDTYYSDSLGYWVYTYDVDYTYQFKVTVYDDKGLTEFGYKVY